MRKKEIKKILSRVDEIPLPPKEKILIACQSAFDKQIVLKARTVQKQVPLARKKMTYVAVVLGSVLVVFVCTIYFMNSFPSGIHRPTPSLPHIEMDATDGSIDTRDPIVIESITPSATLPEDAFTIDYTKSFLPTRAQSFVRAKLVDVCVSSEKSASRLECKFLIIEDYYQILSAEEYVYVDLKWRDEVADIMQNPVYQLLEKYEEYLFYVDGTSIETLKTPTSTTTKKNASVRDYKMFPIQDGKIETDLWVKTFQYEAFYNYYNFGVSDGITLQEAENAILKLYQDYKNGDIYFPWEDPNCKCD